MKTATKPYPSLSDDPYTELAACIDVARLVATRLLVQANSGGGKSYAVRRLLEQTFGIVQHIVIDPDGEYHTLREKYDYVLAGKGGDCPAETKSAALLARRLLELGVSAIIDISELGADRALFVERFIGAMMDAPRDLWHDVLVVIDEAHKYAPEGDRKATAHAAVVDLMSRGRKRGFCGVLATQRVSKLDKSAAAEVNNKLIGRTGLDVDIDRATKELGLHAKDARAQLARLEPGQFWVVGPAFGIAAPQLVQVGSVETTHPDTGSSRSGPPTPPRAHVKELLGQLADLPAEAEAEAKSVDELRGKVKDLEKKLRAEQAGDSGQVATLEAMVDVATKQRDVARLQVNAWEKATEELMEKVANELDHVLTRLTDVRNEIPDTMENLVADLDHDVAQGQGAKPATPSRDQAWAETFYPNLPDKKPSLREHPGLSSMELAVLTALAQHPNGLTKPKLLLHADYAAGGATSRCFAKLCGDGWATSVNGIMTITKMGEWMLGDFDPLPLGTALRRQVLDGSRLSVMEKKILATICDAFPGPLRRGEAVERSGYAAGGATSRALARIIAMDYVETAGRGEVVAAKELFG
jgi:uncharacterized protein